MRKVLGIERVEIGQTRKPQFEKPNAKSNAKSRGNGQFMKRRENGQSYHSDSTPRFPYGQNFVCPFPNYPPFFQSGMHNMRNSGVY